MLENKLIICDSNIPWHHNRYSKHHLMSQLARTNDVVFVDPAEDWIDYRRRPPEHRGTLGNRCWQPPGEALRVFTPLSVPGRRRLGFLQRWDEPNYVRQLRGVIGRYPGRELVLFIGNPWHVFLLEAFPDAAGVVYHCSDNFPALFEGDFRRRLEEREWQLIARADLVVCSHPTLVDKCRQYSDRVHYLEHAVDERFFRPAEQVACPFDLAVGRPPRVGLVGTLDAGIDYDLLREAAQATPEASWALIGPVAEPQAQTVAQLAELPNVRYLGPRPWEQLPEYLWGLQVGVIPYRRSELSQARCPLKLYEYLAAGLTVVGHGLTTPGLLEAYVRQAETETEFVGLVQEAVFLHAERSAGRADQVELLSTKFTWKARAGELASLMEGALAGSPS
ncbi:MAG TPA: glycosyltransferase [Armatimonadota bacterium]|jgi:glycosyltransferase involved in cell wall biosynthesis